MLEDAFLQFQVITVLLQVRLLAVYLECDWLVRLLQTKPEKKASS